MTHTKVKPLEWSTKTLHLDEYDPRRTYADGIGGRYQVDSTGGDVLLWDAADPFSWTQHQSVKDAKAAAQADYEARILSALVPAPAVPDDVAKVRNALRSHSYIGGTDALMDKAADALEALAASVDRANAANEALCADVEAQAAELARKDAALRKLATAACFGNGEVLGRDLRKDPFGREILARMKIAEAALQPTGDA